MASKKPKTPSVSQVGVVAALRPRDLAYLSAIVDSDKGGYPRKRDVLESLHRAWGRCRNLRGRVVAIIVKTCHQEDRERVEREKPDVWSAG